MTMTTDLIKYKKANSATLQGLDLFRHVLSDAPDFGNDASGFSDMFDQDRETNDDIGLLFNLLEQHALEQDGRDRTMSTTVALLKHAHRMIENAELTISKQSDRISHLEELATTDDLTGIINRRGFFDAFIRELDRCERGHSSGGLLVLIDLDNFKMINDVYGHMAGDSCLRLVARTLCEEIRTMDIAARLGGDEFVLLLSNTTKREAAKRAQELGWRLNNLSLAWYGDIIPVRASLGLKSYRKGDKAEVIFNAADIKLYASKKRKNNARNKDKTV